MSIRKDVFEQSPICFLPLFMPYFPVFSFFVSFFPFPPVSLHGHVVFILPSFCSRISIQSLTSVIDFTFVCRPPHFESSVPTSVQHLHISLLDIIVPKCCQTLSPSPLTSYSCLHQSLPTLPLNRKEFSYVPQMHFYNYVIIDKKKFSYYSLT
jgi:hypothetical protein